MCETSSPGVRHEADAPRGDGLIRESALREVSARRRIAGELLLVESGGRFEAVPQLIGLIALVRVNPVEGHASTGGERYQSTLEVHPFKLLHEAEDVTLLAAPETIEAVSGR
jgi:hypothetical protein